MALDIHGEGSLSDELRGQQFELEDWWLNVGRGSWMFEDGNPACLKYAMRSVECNLPLDDEVVYGKVGPFGHLVHVTELSGDAVTP